MEFKDIITKVLAHSELSPAEFAETIGVQRSSISHILSGRNRPSLDFISKIKSAFPQFEWQWLINGEGEMLISDNKKEPNKDKPNSGTDKKTSLPDLFSLIDNENFGKDQTVATKRKNDDVPESEISDRRQDDPILSHSRQVQKADLKSDSVSKTVKRIVFFYDDGTFEAYQN
ncbi:MAG: helix-turn-helix domain-containing protein [Weeksellaceae bacterium]|nr:helix-turn-helix domain-containing protein [Weeksellaceae bacterium]